jgi:hypothetical protein
MAHPINRDMRLAWQFRESRGVMPNSVYGLPPTAKAVSKKVG